ncbi:CRTAC1 family protein [Tautonia rosea]|uniref:CRTAC1 family protein n=1 Tax=Tautonia rosea TaxID=2728037 RepID=UPI001474A971|nr:CRTAC1 family protein [Tautonia rosea]
MRYCGRHARTLIAIGALVVLGLSFGCNQPPEPGADPAPAPVEGIGNGIDMDGARAGTVGDAPSLSVAERYLTIPPYGTEPIDESGFTLASRFSGPVSDRGDLDQVVASIRGRNRRGIEALQKQLAAIDPESLDAPQVRSTIERDIAILWLYEGAFDQAEVWLDRASESAEHPLVSVGLRQNLLALRGVASLRRGETENCIGCVGPSTCLWPIAPGAVHLLPDGASEAADWLSEYLRQRPDDLAMHWVLQLAFDLLGRNTSGEDRRVLPLPTRDDDQTFPRFPNVAEAAGLLSAGPDMAGGSVFDDFNGDDLPDLFWTSYETDLGPRLFLNNGDSTFSDASSRFGLDSYVLAVNCAHADFDNDGFLDVILLRGGWENPAPMTLLRNLGGERFEDVTARAGLADPIASQSAAWGDFDNDGHLDLFVCGEARGGDLDASRLFLAPDALRGDADQRRSRLYRNLGDGTFLDVTAEAGVTNARYAKGASWGDFDNDGWPDLYVSNMAVPNRLYRNLGDGTFEDIAPEAGVLGPIDSFSCGWFDFDNDGHLDLFVTDYSADLFGFVFDQVGEPTSRHLRLYRNNGDGSFSDLAAPLGLNHVFLPMGSSIGDLDGDGFLDLYLATGRPGYSYLMPNVLLRNDSGRRFVDATASSGTGHLQKGHGVSIADFNGDGAADLFVQLGGAVPGDRSYNALFQNPGHDHHWLTLKLVGTRSNRSALGARFTIDLRDPDGSTRSLHRLVSGGTSFSGNALSQTIGLGHASAIESITIRWPVTGSMSQVLDNVPMDGVIEVVEGTE